MYGTEIELNTLSNTDRTRTKHQYLLLSAGLCYLILAAEAGVIIWSLCREFCRTGIYHLISCHDAIVFSHGLDLFLALAGQSGDHIIREFDPFCFF